MVCAGRVWLRDVRSCRVMRCRLIMQLKALTWTQVLCQCRANCSHIRSMCFLSRLTSVSCWYWARFEVLTLSVVADLILCIEYWGKWKIIEFDVSSFLLHLQCTVHRLFTDDNVTYRLRSVSLCPWLVTRTKHYIRFHSAIGAVPAQVAKEVPVRRTGPYQHTSSPNTELLYSEVKLFVRKFQH